MNEFSMLFLAALAAVFVVQIWLARRHINHITSHRSTVPEAFSDKITLQAHQLAADYTLTKTRASLYELTISYVLLLIWTLGGALNALDIGWRLLDLSPIITGILFIISATLIMSLLDIPTSAYHTFVIEQRFGFNRTKVGTFISDLVKNTVLSLIIGIPLLWTILWLMENAGQYWWLYAWLVWMGFSFVMMWAYPAFIAPLFNKFTPLSDETLKTKIENLLSRCGFTSKGIFVMDGSRRSGHGNAYFTGLGSNKRIVFFDTLIKSLNHDETEAVLAHELGHFKHKHVLKRMITMAMMSLAGLAILGWLMQQTWFYQGLGVETSSIYAALILFMLVMPIFTFFLNPVMAFLMRKHEFEADDYAAEQCEAQSLVNALVKLYEENASTLTPDPVFSSFYDSHPPAAIRVAHLTQKSESHPNEVTA